MTDDFSDDLDREDLEHDDLEAAKSATGDATEDWVAAEPAPAPAATGRTGHPQVDGVLESLDALADAPVAAHVAVFEAAHDRLRQALAGAGDAAAPPRG